MLCLDFPSSAAVSFAGSFAPFRRGTLQVKAQVAHTIDDFSITATFRGSALIACTEQRVSVATALGETYPRHTRRFVCNANANSNWRKHGNPSPSHRWLERSQKPMASVLWPVLLNSVCGVVRSTGGVCADRCLISSRHGDGFVEQ